MRTNVCCVVRTHVAGRLQWLSIVFARWSDGAWHSVATLLYTHSAVMLACVCVCEYGSIFGYYGILKCWLIYSELISMGGWGGSEWMAACHGRHVVVGYVRHNKETIMKPDFSDRVRFIGYTPMSMVLIMDHQFWQCSMCAVWIPFSCIEMRQIYWNRIQCFVACVVHLTGWWSAFIWLVCVCVIMRVQIAIMPILREREKWPLMKYMERIHVMN